ncbi:MAG: hypothetical protein ACOC8B_07100 [Gemmatimonadota bacterium]
MRTRIIGALALVFGLAVPVQAQIAWDSPLLVPPRADDGFGLFLTDPQGGSLGFLGTWRPSAAPPRLQFRLGLAEETAFADDLAVYGGVDGSSLITRATDEFPLDVAWAAGVGISVGDIVNVAFPFGLVLGRTFTDGDASFTPYVSPRVVLDAIFDHPVADDDLDLDLAVDLGLDLGLGGWLIRFGGTVGDREALAIGIVF